MLIGYFIVCDLFASFKKSDHYDIDYYVIVLKHDASEIHKWLDLKSDLYNNQKFGCPRGN